MKKILSALALGAVLFASCKKGDTGPAGPAGADGNADVTVFNYGERTFSGTSGYLMSDISQAKMDASFILAYYNPSTEAATSWYPMPGLGSGGTYDTRYLVYQSSTTPSVYTFSLRLMKPDGSGIYTTDVTFTKTRIFLVPASKVLAGGKMVRPVDFSDYHAVCRYYNIPE